jgi:hypothetical protein
MWQTFYLSGTFPSFSPHPPTQQLHLFSDLYLFITGNKQYTFGMTSVIKYHHPITMPSSLEHTLIILYYILNCNLQASELINAWCTVSFLFRYLTRLYHLGDQLALHVLKLSSVLTAEAGKFPGPSYNECLYFISQPSYPTEVISQNLLWKQFN